MIVYLKQQVVVSFSFNNFRPFVTLTKKKVDFTAETTVNAINSVVGTT